MCAIAACIEGNNMADKKQGEELRRMAAQAPSAPPPAAPPTAGAAAPPSGPATDDTIRIALDRSLLLRLKRYCLTLQEQTKRRVSQREVAEQAIGAFLDSKEPAINLTPPAEDRPDDTVTISLDRTLGLRLKRYALDQQERLGWRVTQRLVAERVLDQLLTQAGFPAA
jgi:hypothetical protein